jgi:hypothetical protein
VLKRFAEVAAVVAFMAALMAAGAGLYAWLGPESGEEPPQSVSTPTSTPIPHSPPPWASETYLHPSGLWRIDLPKGWSGRYNPPFVNTVEYTPFTSESSGRVTVFRFSDHDFGNDLYTYSGVEINKKLNQAPSSNLMSFQRVNIGGFPAYEAISTYRNVVSYTDGPRTSEPEGHIELWLFVDSQAFAIDARIPVAQWNDEKDMLRQIVHSFQPLEPSSAR